MLVVPALSQTDEQHTPSNVPEYVGEYYCGIFDHGPPGVHFAVNGSPDVAALEHRVSEFSNYCDDVAECFWRRVEARVTVTTLQLCALQIASTNENRTVRFGITHKILATCLLLDDLTVFLE